MVNFFKQAKAANQLKKDFYGLGRHKVKEYERAGREIRLTVTAQDSAITINRTCVLRDFW